MSTLVADLRPVRFTTDDAPERERISLWRDFYGPHILRVEIDPAADVPFHAEVTARRLPGVCLVSSRFSPARISRLPALLADGNDDLALVATSSGSLVSQRRRELELGAGDVVVLSNAEAGSNASSSANERCSIHIRRAALGPLVPNLDDAILRTVPGNTQTLQYLFSYVRFLHDGRTLDRPELAHTVAAHVRDLVALVLGATGDAAIVAESGGMRAARLQAMKDYVAKNAGNGALTVHDLAAHHRVSPRYVQRLFETEGATFSEYLLERRLLRAHRMLADPCHAERAVSAIAIESGFGDVSYFNRCFRRRFGASPTQFRGANARYSSQ